MGIYYLMSLKYVKICNSGSSLGYFIIIYNKGVKINIFD